jgi:hypothetical protein
LERVEKASGQNVFHKLALGPFRMIPKKKGILGKARFGVE